MTTNSKFQLEIAIQKVEVFRLNKKFAASDVNFLFQVSFCAVGVIKTGNFHMIDTLCKHLDYD